MEDEGLAERISSRYQRYIENGEFSYFDKIGFLNVGYWNGVNDSLEVAQINLIETLISFFSNMNGNVLDVACGKGASSKFLTKYFNPKEITGINISKQQLEICRVVAPECGFQHMDATKLDFKDASVDNVLCIEAAFHFLTRYKFFEESYRVLKPSGRLAMLDVLCNYDLLESLDSEDAMVCPRENYLPDLDAYRESLLKAGFSYVRVDECTELTGTAACSHVIKMAERTYGRTRDVNILERIRKTALLYKACAPWCMVYAIK